MALFGMLAERLVGAPDPRLSAVFHHHGDHRARIFFCLRGWHDLGHRRLQDRNPVQPGVLRIGSLVLAYDKLSVIAATIILCALLYLFFNKTTLGTAMRASSENMLAAYYMGIPVKRGGVDRVGDQRRGRDLRGRAAGADHVHSLQCRPGARPQGVSGGGARRLRSIPGAVVGGVLIGVIESMAGFLSAARVEGRRTLHRSAGGVCCSSRRACSAFHMRKKV